jgi:hypothetical protein
VQNALREHVPTRYFADLENFANTKTAYPMLVYQASRAFRGKMRTELTYDVLNPKSLAALFRTVKVSLPDLLDRVEARLNDLGRGDLAAKYAPRKAAEIAQSVERLSKSRKCLYVLIRAEALLVNALLDLGGLGALTPRERARRVASFEKRWSFQLRRLYPGTDFTWLAPILLLAATEALSASLNAPAGEMSGAGLPAPESLDPKSGGL